MPDLCWCDLPEPKEDGVCSKCDGVIQTRLLPDGKISISLHDYNNLKQDPNLQPYFNSQ